MMKKCEKLPALKEVLLQPILLLLKKFFSTTGPRHDMRFLWLGAFIGLGSAILAIIFRLFINKVVVFFFGATASEEEFWLKNSSLAFIGIPTLLLVPMVAGAFVSWFTRKFAPEAEGHGVPEIMNAVITNRGYLRARVGLVKLIASSLSIGSGFSVGREGPTALIGATLGSITGRILDFPIQKMKLVVGCGAAAGIAATFNAPLAGTAFALELVVGSVGVRYLAPIILSAMIATVTTHYYYGNFHDLFSTLRYDVKHPLELIIYAGLGLLAGIMGIFFTKTLYWAEDQAAKINIPVYLKGALGGLGITMILIIAPILSGPATWAGIHQTLSENITRELALACLLLSIAKILTTSWSLALGASGGIFAPSLFIGGNLGVAYGFFAHQLFPNFTEEPFGYALVGMGALVASVTQAPLTAVAIIFEMTNNMTIILPLIISCAFALGIFNHFMEGSIYTLKLKKRGLNIEWGRETGALENVKIKNVYRPVEKYFYEGTPIQEAIEYFRQGTESSVPVVSHDLKLKGIISFWDIRNAMKKIDHLENKKVEDLMKKEVQYVEPHDNLYKAFILISSGDYDSLPVINNQREKKLIGRLSRSRLLQVYKNQLTLRGIIDTQPEIK